MFALAAPHFLRNDGATDTACRSLIEAGNILRSISSQESWVVGLIAYPSRVTSRCCHAQRASRIWRNGWLAQCVGSRSTFLAHRHFDS